MLEPTLEKCIVMVRYFILNQSKTVLQIKKCLRYTEN
jgi:hypothetical protein